MIGLIFKSLLALSLSYIFLSFTYNGDSFFSHLQGITGPVGKNIQSALSDSFETSWDKSKDLGKQLFTNSKPKNYLEDKVKKTQSSTRKVVKKAKHTLMEDLREEESRTLSNIIERQ